MENILFDEKFISSNDYSYYTGWEVALENFQKVSKEETKHKTIKQMLRFFKKKKKKS